MGRRAVSAMVVVVGNLSAGASGCSCDGGSDHADGSPGADGSPSGDAAAGDAGGDLGRRMLVGYTTGEAGDGYRRAWVAALGPDHVPLATYEVSGPGVAGTWPHLLRFTADASRFVYHSDPEEQGHRDLFTVDVTGEVPGPSHNATANLTGRVDKSLLSAGNRALCRTGTPTTGDLFLADVGHLPPPPAEPVTDPDWWVDDMVWAPTGTSAVFSAQTASGRPYRVYHVALDQPPYAPIRLAGVAVSGGSAPLQFAPDGSMYLVAGNALFLVDVASHTPVELDGSIAFSHEARFTSDSRWVVTLGQTAAGEDRLYAVDVSAPSPGSLDEIGRPQHDAVRRFWLAPDGKKLVYSNGGDVQSGTSLFWIDSAGAQPGEPVEIAKPPGQRMYEVAFSPDGQKLTAVGFDADADQLIYVADASGSQPGEFVPVAGPIPFASEAILPEFSPDGRWLLFGADVELDDQMELYVVDLAAADPVPVAVSGPMVPGASIETGGYPVPEFTPDSGAVLFVANAEDVDYFNLYVVDLTGDDPGRRHRVNQEFAATSGNVSLDIAVALLR